MPDTYVFTDPYGTEHRFVGDRPPTDAEVNDVMRAAGDEKAAHAQAKAEAGSHFGGEGAGIGERFLAGAVGLRNPAADQPMTLSDWRAHPGEGLKRALSPENIGAVVRDATLLGAGRKGSSPGELPSGHPPTPFRDAVRTAGDVLQGAPGVGAIGRTVGRLMTKTPVPKTFNDLPLAEQMSYLPTNGSAPQVRQGTIPIRSTSINDRPLAAQMDQLPQANSGNAPSRPTMPIQPPQTPFHELPLYKQMEQLPQTPTPEGVRYAEPPAQMPTTAQIPVGLSPAERVSGLSASEYASLVRRYGPEAAARIQQRMAQQPVENGTAPPNSGANSPLREPRIEQGALRTGRQAGLTKEEVRQQTGPVLNEEPGEASPILPKSALKNIIDTMRSLSPAEREAYVARASSGKTMAQVENLRRTLEHLGLIVPFGVGAALSRQSLLGRMDQGQN